MDRNNIQLLIHNLNECGNDLSNGTNGTDEAVSIISLFYNKLSFEKDNDQRVRDIDAILKKETGIWSFLYEIKKFEKPSKHLLDALSDLLKLIIEFKDRLCLEHTALFFNYCRNILSSVTISCYDVKDFAFKLFLLITKRGDFHFCTEKRDDTLSFLKTLYWNLDRSKSTEKKEIFQLIGNVVENFPIVFSDDEKFLEKVSRNIASQLKKILEKSDGGKIVEVEGMLECLFALFKNYPRCTERYNENFYKHIKTVTKRESSKHVALRAAIKIVRAHFNLFTDCIKEDFEFWYKLLNRYLESSNKDDSKAARDALDEFYPKMAALLCEKTELNQTILKFFITNLRNDLKSNHQYKTELAVKHFINFADSCKKLGQDCLFDEMFNLTFHLLESYYSSFPILNHDQLINLSDLLQSTSGFLRHLNTGNMDENYLRTLEKSSIMSISSFTKLPSNKHFLIKAPILKTIINVAATNESYFDSFLENIIYSGIVMSCSHMTEGTVECLQSTCTFENESLLKELVTYKEYLPFWEGLLHIKNHASDSRDLKLINEIQMESKICDKFIECTIKIIEKLDLSMKAIEDHDQEKPLMVEYDLIPCSNQDFNIFVNLVEMFTNLFSKRKREFSKWIPILNTKLIEFTHRHEIKFGFYQLLTVVFKQVKYERDIDANELRSFVMEELNHLSELQKTDSKACLQMIMNLPVIVVKEILTDVAPALQAAFERGSEDLPLAEEALSTLEKWYLNTPKDTFRPVLSEVIPYLKPFIQSKRFAGETDDYSKYEKDLINKVMSDPRSQRNQKYRQAYTQSGDSELDKIQKKVVKFLGKIDTDIWMPVFTPESYLKWETVNILKFDFTFKDMKIEIFLDNFLPRIIDLSCHSSDLKTRIAACEVLHSCVIIFLGNTNHFESAFPNEAPNLFKKIISMVFKLGADVNDTVQQLFRPLSLELARYYSKKIQALSLFTNAFLEILFDGVTVKNDATFRKFIAEIISEFVRWSLKENFEQNVNVVIKQICLFCLQPCSYRKLGAALAFNTMHRELKKHETIRNDYWITLFLHFVKNMSTSRKNDCNNIEVGLAIDNLMRIIIDDFGYFNGMRIRIKPSWFGGDRLFQVQVWSFQQCFSANELCRSKCMDFLSKLLDGNDGRPPLHRFIGVHVLAEFEIQANKIKNLDILNEDIINETIAWMQLLSATLHCFYWMITKGGVDPTLFLRKEYKLFEAVIYFVEFMSNVDLKTFISNKFPNKKQNLMASDEKQFAILREELIYKILQIFAHSVSLTCSINVENQWTKNFTDIYIKCLFDAYEVFPYTRSKIDLQSALVAIPSHLSKPHPLRIIILKKIQDHSYWDTFTTILNDSTKAQSTRKQNTQVLFILREANILSEIFEVLHLDLIVSKIFDQLVFEDKGIKKALVPDITVISYFQDYLSYALDEKFSQQFNVFVGYIFNDEKLELNSSYVTHGMHFFNRFQIPILEYLLNHNDEFIDKCIDDLDYNRMDMLEVYLKYAASKSKDCSVILKHWNILKNFTSASNDKIPDLLNILEFATRNMEVKNIDHLAKVYKWLLECLYSKNTSTMIKHQTLDLLPSFMKFDFCAQHDDDLKVALRNLETEEITNKPSTEGAVVYDKLLIALQKTANRSLFEFVIPIAIIKKDPFSNNISNILMSLMDRSYEQQLEILQTPLNLLKNPQLLGTYQDRNFPEMSNNPGVEKILRIGILELFLVPMLHCASKEAKAIFYVEELSYILSTAEAKIEENYAQETNLLISQIGALQLIETFYELVEDIDDDRFKRALFGDDFKNGSLHGKTSKIAKAIVIGNPNLKNKENEDLLIKLRSHAFNALIKILRKTRIDKNQEIGKWLKFIFENAKIWKHIIKTEPPIKLTMTVEQVRTRRKEIAQKRRIIKQEVRRSLSIATEYATCSSLAPEIAKYDTNHFTVNNTANVTIEDVNLFCEERELDILNTHESMGTLGELIKYLENYGRLVTVNENNEPQFPEWMDCILKALKYFQKHCDKCANIVLFMLKFIVNNESAFRPFAKYWFPTLLESLLNLNQLNYVVTDVVLVLLQWHAAVEPGNREAIGDLFKMFLVKIPQHGTTSRNYLMQMMKAMIQAWNPYFDVPYREIRDLLRSSDSMKCNIGLDISKYFLLNNVFPYDMETMKEVKNIFLRKVMGEGNDKGDAKPAAKIVGLILRTASLKNDGTLDPAYEQVRADVVSIMKKINTTPGVKTVDHFRILEHIVSNYPPLLQSFVASYFLEKFSLLQGDYKKSCLKVLAANAALLPDDAFTILLNNGFAFCLKTKDHDLIECALNFIKEFMPRIQINQMEKLMDDISTLATHNSPQCREAVYKVADLVYDKYRNETSDLRAKELLAKSRDILLAGLLDSDAELQQKIYESWKTRSNLEDTIPGRFLNIINTMYSPLLEAHFISYAVDFLLEACSDIESLIFPNPLLNCSFQEHKIISSWRKKHTSLAPLLMNSLAYNIATLASQQTGTGTLSFQVYRTQSTMATPTISLEPSTSTVSRSMYRSGGFHPLKYIPPPNPTTTTEEAPKNKISIALDQLQRRITENSAEASKKYAIRNAKLNEKRKEILADRADRRDKNVDLKRNYRKGDYPDIQIKKSELITPLKVLAKRDPLIAKQIFSAVFLGLVKEVKERQNYLQQIELSFNAILQCTQQRGSICLETLFEIAYAMPKELKLDLQSVSIVSNMDNLLSLRALLLENSLIYDDSTSGPSTAKKQRTGCMENDSLWIQLAEVYKSLDKYDVVNGIFKEKIISNSCQQLKNGLQSETVGNWEHAYQIYDSEVKNMADFNLGSQDQKFILEAYYKCSAYLSKWDDMNETIRGKFSSSFDGILSDDWHKEYTLPWLFLSEAYRTVYKRKLDDGFKTETLKLVKDDPFITDHLAEPLSILQVMYDERKESKLIANKSMDWILKEFNFTDSSVQKFLKLQTLSEISNMLSVLEDSSKVHKEIDLMLKIWERSEPSKNNTTWWDRRMRYRYLFSEMYGKVANESMDEDSSIMSKRLKDYELYSKLNFCEKALDQQNYMLASKYTVDAYMQVDLNSTTEWSFKLISNLCRMYTFRADKNNSSEYAIAAIEEMKKAQSNQWKCDYECSMVASSLFLVLKNKFNLWSTEEKAAVQNVLIENAEGNSIDWNDMIYKNYERASQTAEEKVFPDVQISSAYLSMAKHCREILSEQNNQDVLELETQIAISILKSMKYNSKEAYQLFPVILQLNSSNHEDFINTFIALCAEVEEWKFLSWINQLLVYIDTNKVSMIKELLLRMAEKYPKAFQFPFAISKEAFKLMQPLTRTVLKRIEEILPKTDNISDFITALSFVSEPARLWVHYGRTLEQSLDRDDLPIVNQKFEKVKQEIVKFSGKFWTKCESVLDDSLKLVVEGQLGYREEIKKRFKNYEKSLEKIILGDKKSHMELYSKWLYKFSDQQIDEIEIPGQYEGFSIPHPERHLKVFGFFHAVKMMDSKQKPVKITIIGNDARHYPYLVKFDEDIRQDQRIEQLFHIINQALESKFYCNSQHLSLNTYGIFPLKSYLGLIEWVENSATLKDFRYFGLKNDEKIEKSKFYAQMRNNYMLQLGQKFGHGSGNNDAEIFTSAVKDPNNKSGIIAHFRSFKNQIEDDIFKKALLTMTSNPHSFWCLRNQFMTSYSTMSICSWILGIGDRHLDNILVCLKTGTCIGIDFGYAFGTGTDFLPVPELIPFRMTPHIESIMAPFDLTGLIKETIIQVLQTVRENDYVLLATMPVFILDPSLDWCKYARKQFQCTGTQNQAYFEDKIENVKLKLQGHHPLNVMIKELNRNPNIRHVSQSYVKLVKESNGAKISLNNNNLNTEEQVDRLLGLATDEYVLGTSWCGLETWF